MCCILQLIDRANFMTSSLSNLVNNLPEGIHKIKRKDEHNEKIRKACRIKYKYCDCFLEIMSCKESLIEYKCLLSNKKCQ